MKTIKMKTTPSDFIANRTRLSNFEFGKLIPKLPLADLLLIEVKVNGFAWVPLINVLSVEKLVFECIACHEGLQNPKELVLHLNDKRHATKVKYLTDTVFRTSQKQLYHPVYTFAMGEHTFSMKPTKTQETHPWRHQIAANKAEHRMLSFSKLVYMRAHVMATKVADYVRNLGESIPAQKFTLEFSAKKIIDDAKPEDFTSTELNLEWRSNKNISKKREKYERLVKHIANAVNQVEKKKHSKKTQKSVIQLQNMQSLLFNKQVKLKRIANHLNLVGSFGSDCSDGDDSDDSVGTDNVTPMGNVDVLPKVKTPLMSMESLGANNNNNNNNSQRKRQKPLLSPPPLKRNMNDNFRHNRFTQQDNHWNDQPKATRSAASFAVARDDSVGTDNVTPMGNVDVLPKVKTPLMSMESLGANNNNNNNNSQRKRQKPLLSTTPYKRNTNDNFQHNRFTQQDNYWNDPPKATRSAASFSVASGDMRELRRDNKSAPEIIPTLRLMTVFEDLLGSLGPKVIDLFSETLVVGKTEPTQLNSKMLTFKNCMLLETAVEKLKGVLEAESIQGSKLMAINNVIRQTTDLIASAEKMRPSRSGLPSMDSIPPELDAEAVLSAASLSSQGRSDLLSPHQLQQLMSFVEFSQSGGKIKSSLMQQETNAIRNNSNSGHNRPSSSITSRNANQNYLSGNCSDSDMNYSTMHYGSDEGDGDGFDSVGHYGNCDNFNNNSDGSNYRIGGSGGNRCSNYQSGSNSTSESTLFARRGETYYSKGGSSGYDGGNNFNTNMRGNNGKNFDFTRPNNNQQEYFHQGGFYGNESGLSQIANRNQNLSFNSYNSQMKGDEFINSSRRENYNRGGGNDAGQDNIFRKLGK